MKNRNKKGIEYKMRKITIKRRGERE